MKDISFHITDIVQNSIRAQATEISIDITETNDMIYIRITDNGCGMDETTLSHIRDPFYTTRTTRHVGLGIPFLIQNTEQTGGNVSITSSSGKGTEVFASFIPSHIDCPPWGDLSGTIALLITGNPGIDIKFYYTTDKTAFSLSSSQLIEILDGLLLSHPKVALFLKEMIAGGLETEENL